MDSNGTPDVLAISKGDHALRWFSNSGGTDPTFTPLLIATGVEGLAFDVADMDSDGDLDVVCALESGGLAWLESDGTAVPSFITHPILGTADAVTLIQIADITPDGNIDLVVLSSTDSTVYVYENNGSLSFTESAVITDRPSIADIGVGDFSGSGLLDILVMDTDSVHAYFNTGSTPPVYVSHQIDYFQKTGFGGRHIEIGDFDQDGDLDAAFTSDDNKLRWYHNDGTGFGDDTSMISSQANPGALHLADMHNDGALDVLVALGSAGGSVTLFENYQSSLAIFPDIPRHLANGLSGVNGIAAADFDGDFDVDFITITEGDSILRWYENKPSIFPCIESGPNSKVIDAGLGGTLTVFATEAVSYLWHRDGVALVDDEHIIGTQSDSLQILDSSILDAGLYWCIVSNANGNSTSPSAIIAIRDPCVPDLNDDGELDFFDISEFLSQFSSGCPIP